MARQLQLRRGTSAEHQSFTGAQGEITYDTTNNRLRVHNGGQAGGYAIPRYNEVVTLSGANTISGIKTFTNHINRKTTSLAYSDIPESQTFISYYITDKNDQRFGAVEIGKSTDGSNSMQLNAANKNSNNELTWTTTPLGIGVTNTGQTFTYAPTPNSSSNDNNIATTKFVNDRLNEKACPTGTIVAYAGTTAPTGWLMCNGQAVSRTTYSALYEKIGTAYGTGDGSTTFNLPNYTDRVAQGLGRGYVAAGLPNITGWAQLDDDLGWKEAGGAMTVSNSYSYDVASNRWGSNNHNVNIDASLSSSIYGNSTTVQPPAVKTYWIIKY